VAELSPLRSATVVIIGAAIYFALLWVFYSITPYAPIPQWWRNFMPNGAVALGTWFSFLNVAGAILAAIPVAYGIVIAARVRRIALAVAIGLVPALYIVVGSIMEFGAPPSVTGWVVDIAQFLAVSLSVVAMVALVRGFPLTIGSSDRGVASSVDQGESR
jgi:hypothetical protein